MNCGKPSHIRKWFGPCVLSYGHGGSCEHPPLEALHESDGRCSKCGNDREAWDRAVAEIAHLTAERDRAVAELAAARARVADLEARPRITETLLAAALVGSPDGSPWVDLDAVAQDFRDAMEGPPGNRAAIKFYRETWPALIDEVRAARAEIAALRAKVDEAKRRGLEAAHLAVSLADDASEYGATPDAAQAIAAALEAL